MRRSAAIVVAWWIGLTAVATAAVKAPPDKASEPNPQALALVAEAQMRLSAGEIADGLKLLGRAVELDPNDPGLAEEFGMALADAGIADQALKQLKRSDDLSPNGEATLGMLLAQGSDSPAELEAALPHLRRGLDAVPQGAQVRMVLAQSLVRLGKGGRPGSRSSRSSTSVRAIRASGSWPVSRCA